MYRSVIQKTDIKLLDKLALPEIVQKTMEIRKQVIDVCIKNEAGHIAPSLSCIDIICSLYYKLMNLSESPKWEGRDRLVFSKAHGCYGVYAILADIGYINQKDWLNFYVDSFLKGCIERSPDHGIEVGCGALGHGLPMAVGMAFGAKLQNKDFKVYAIVGDGEMQEGSNWEAVQVAAKHQLDNLFIIIDNNRLQAMDFLDNVLTIEGKENDLYDKMTAFGCDVKRCNGHDPEAIIHAIESWPFDTTAPRALIAETTKGYGLYCMENVAKFHFRLPTENELEMGNRYDSRTQ
jgi:transketolase